MKIANAPVSWGVFELTADNPHLPSPDDVLSNISAIGYTGTELGPLGFLGTADETRARLREHGLDLAGAFLPMRFSRQELFEGDLEILRRSLDLLHAVSEGKLPPKVVLSDAVWEPERMRLTGRIANHPETQLVGDRFRIMVDNLNQAADECLERGFDAVLHPHAGSFIETDAEVHRVMDAVDTTRLGLCLDTGHARFGGSDPLELIDDFAAIIRHVHIKDCDTHLLAEVIEAGQGLFEAWERGVFTELGRGSSKVAETVRKLQAIGYDGWLVVEQDHIPSPGETLAELSLAQGRNFEYLAALLGPRYDCPRSEAPPRSDSQL